ncbi:MAG: MOSC N-terminal beta barrel domain-containing protein [Gammaproteobacteria bacterium]|nr:MOSC N-terminal beta barrel domain-containing protein [Gammaproteobacteria bacterium]NNF60116.1 MOSC domain-containing protein [Gammaproteobacteria bacterium]NNM21528.1 MOSC domain-containing protein [Gammaproteobacteria bacterium]
MATLSRIFVYPIKSTAPVELVTANVEAEGLQHDRRYVVTDARGRFFTARRFPRLVLVRSEIDGDGLIVSAPGTGDLQLAPADFPSQYDPITVWKDTVQGQRCGPQADAWFSDYLGLEARLYFMGEKSRRLSRAGGVVSYADAAPLLVLSENSVADLNTRLVKKVRMRNFRPNLVVSGCEACAEDSFGDFTIGDVAFESLWQCSRCVLTTIDPDTAEVDANRQPLATLMDYRRRNNDECVFGMNVAATGVGTVHVGQEIVLSQTR